jgi:hypothetical protein
MDERLNDEVLARGREILEAEGEAVLAAAGSLDVAFCRAVRLVEACTGSVVVTGIGKAGLVARKICPTTNISPGFPPTSSNSRWRATASGSRSMAG